MKIYVAEIELDFDEFSIAGAATSIETLVKNLNNFDGYTGENLCITEFDESTNERTRFGVVFLYDNGGDPVELTANLVESCLAEITK